MPVRQFATFSLTATCVKENRLLRNGQWSQVNKEY